MKIELICPGYLPLGLYSIWRLILGQLETYNTGAYKTEAD